MEQNGKNRSLEELFRGQLDSYEVKPSWNFWPRFEKKLRAREFLKFNPGKFNIGYLSVAVAAGVVAVVLLTGGNKKLNETGTPAVIKDQILMESVVDPASPSLSSNQVNITESQGETKKIVIEKIDTDSANSVRVNNNKRLDENETLQVVNQKLAVKVIAPDEAVKTDKLVKPIPRAGFDLDVKSGCTPLQVSFDNLSLNFDSCIWDFGDGGYSTANDPIWVFDEPGNYEVSLIVFGSDNNRAVLKKFVTAHPSPVSRFEVSAGEPALPEEEVTFYNYSEGSVAWKWEFGDGKISNEFEPAHFYSSFGSYSVKLTAYSEFGCVDSMEITNAFGDNSCFVKFPNVFIPNEGGPTGGYYSNRSDEQSDVFHPVWSGVTKYQLSIYSRQGILVFESSDISIGWDGYYKGQKAETGVYIWKVRGLYKNGDTFVKGGDVTLFPKW